MTPRQKQLLQAIVEYYVQTANPVGSLNLSQKFGYSPATIRAEMVELERLGFIVQPHTSAGRVPTDEGYRLYVDHLRGQIANKKQKIDRVEQAIEHRLRAAGEPTRAMHSAVDSLVETTNNLGLGLIGSTVYMSGLTNLFSQPEFSQPDRIYEVAYLLDNLVPWLQETAPINKVNIYIGKESPIGKASGCSIIISRFASPLSDYSYIGVVGSTRQSYPRVIRLVEHASQQLEEILNG